MNPQTCISTWTRAPLHRRRPWRTPRRDEHGRFIPHGTPGPVCSRATCNLPFAPRRTITSSCNTRYWPCHERDVDCGPGVSMEIGERARWLAGECRGKPGKWKRRRRRRR